MLDLTDAAICKSRKRRWQTEQVLVKKHNDWKQLHKEFTIQVGDTLLLIPCVAAVILDEKNRIVLQEKHGEAWSLPAGMIEPGESPKLSVVREVKEETGLVVTPEKILGVFGGNAFRYKYPNGDLVESTVILMRCSILSDSGLVTDSETKSLRYYDKKSMPELALPYPEEALFDELSEPYLM